MTYTPINCPVDDKFFVVIDRADPGANVYWQMSIDAPAHASGLKTSDLPTSDPEAAQLVRSHVIAGWVSLVSNALYMATRRLERYREDRIPANLLAAWTSMQEGDALMQLDGIEHTASHDWPGLHQKVRAQVVTEMLAYAETQLSIDRKGADTAEKEETHETLGYAVLAEYGNAKYLLELAALGKPLPRQVPNMKFSRLRERVAERYSSSPPTVSRAWRTLMTTSKENLEALRTEVETLHKKYIKAEQKRALEDKKRKKAESAESKQRRQKFRRDFGRNSGG